MANIFVVMINSFCYIIDVNKHVIEALESFMPKVMNGERMGLVFNMAYGVQGESRYTHISAILEIDLDNEPNAIQTAENKPKTPPKKYVRRL